MGPLTDGKYRVGVVVHLLQSGGPDKLSVTDISYMERALRPVKVDVAICRIERSVVVDAALMKIQLFEDLEAIIG
jgi:hypothetical protein